jgi:hypothetical protein
MLFLCFRKVTQEILSELDETKAEQGVAQGMAAPPYGEPHLVHL